MGPDVKMNAYVPMDDDHTLQWEVFYRTDGPARPQRMVPINRTNEPQESGRGGRYLPQGTGWHDRWVLEQNLDNDYFIDREAQKNWESYSGIPGVRQQDMAVTETMGPIYNRSREHLGTSDSMIIRTRRRWLAVARAFADQDVEPPNVDNPQAYRLRSGEVLIPRSADWWDGSRDLREKSLAHPPELAKTEIAGG
jgi:hypothetical protein